MIFLFLNICWICSDLNPLCMLTYVVTWHDVTVNLSRQLLLSLFRTLLVLSSVASSVPISPSCALVNSAQMFCLFCLATMVCHLSAFMFGKSLPLPSALCITRSPIPLSFSMVFQWKGGTIQGSVSDGRWMSLSEVWSGGGKAFASMSERCHCTCLPSEGCGPWNVFVFYWGLWLRAGVVGG